eukprot:jgi/Tetstr1/464529/TSEL_009286.t1
MFDTGMIERAVQVELVLAQPDHPALGTIQQLPAVGRLSPAVGGGAPGRPRSTRVSASDSCLASSVTMDAPSAKQCSLRFGSHAAVELSTATKTCRARGAVRRASANDFSSGQHESARASAERRYQDYQLRSIVL